METVKRGITLLLAAVMVALGCAACGAGGESEEISLEKAVRIEKWLALDESLLCTVEGEEELEKVESRLLADHAIEDMKTLPEGLTPLYCYVVFQEPTVLLSQEEGEERPLEELLRITLYEDSDLMTMEIAPGVMEDLPLVGDLLTFTWSAPREDVEYLKAYPDN